MAVFQYIGTWLGSSLNLPEGFDAPVGAASIRAMTTGANVEFEITDYAQMSSSTVSLNSAGAPQLIDASMQAAAESITVTLGGFSGTLPTMALDHAVAEWSAGERSADPAPLSAGVRKVSVLAAQIDGADMLILAGQGGPGVTYAPVTNGTLGAAVRAGGQDVRYANDITDMVVVETGAQTHLFVGSASDHGVAGFTFGADGTLSANKGLGVSEGLPVDTVTALETTEIAGQDFLIVAASGTSSLTIMAVSEDGSLRVTDHLIDDRTTRFQGVTQLEVAVVGGQTFVLAAGMDDGISLFRLTAEGRLVHQDTIADTTAMALAGLSGLGVAVTNSGLEILTTSANEAGLSRFSVAFGDPGIVAVGTGGTLAGTSGADMLSLRTAPGRLSGGAGDDILSDGAGQDTLNGGAGSDLFVLSADGRADVIEDFQLGLDRLDLSAWPRLYSPAQIRVESTAWGAILHFGDEELSVRTSDGQTFDADDLPLALASLLSHVPVVAATPPEPEPEPEPESEPEPVGGLISGTTGNDTLTGSDGDDILLGRAGDDVLDAGAGNDMIAASSGNDRVFGGAGNDSLGGGFGDDFMDGGTGNDVMGGGRGNDTMHAGDGDDLLSGGPGNDYMIGGAGNDMLAGSYGNDTIEGGDGDDNIGGGGGHDEIYGEDGNDTFGGGDGDDTIFGGAGDDFVAGGDRDDVLSGDGGNDTLNGGFGDDILSGGDGADYFVFNDISDGERDVILDFTPDVDTIRMRGIAGDNQSERYSALSFTSDDQGTLLVYGGHEIWLQDVSASDLDRGDFILL